VPPNGYVGEGVIEIAGGNGVVWGVWCRIGVVCDGNFGLCRGMVVCVIWYGVVYLDIGVWCGMSWYCCPLMT